jgi:hypothetical protein
LEDENAVDVLQSSKILSDEISEKQTISDETEAKIDEARAGYKPVAHHSSLLYFVVRLLYQIDSQFLSCVCVFEGNAPVRACVLPKTARMLHVSKA